MRTGMAPASEVSFPPLKSTAMGLIFVARVTGAGCVMGVVVAKLGVVMVHCVWSLVDKVWCKLLHNHILPQRPLSKNPRR